MTTNGASLPAPLGLLAELTHRCPLGCPYCSNPLALDRRDDELDSATWGRVFNEAAALGILQVHLSGGEPAALCVVDAVVRLLPGALGDHESASSDSHYEGLLAPPSYTRPPSYRGLDVPDVLLSGDHDKIAAWRAAEAERLTRERRPDLWANHDS